jgi:hypothetical protein
VLIPFLRSRGPLSDAPLKFAKSPGFVETHDNMAKEEAYAVPPRRGKPLNSNK